MKKATREDPSAWLWVANRFKRTGPATVTTYEANVARPAQAIVEKFRQSVVKLSLKMHGCRVIQKALLSDHIKRMMQLKEKHPLGGFSGLPTRTPIHACRRVAAWSDCTELGCGTAQRMKFVPLIKPFWLRIASRACMATTWRLRHVAAVTYLPA